MAGSVNGRPAMIVDDMVSTGGTLLQAVKWLREAGATAVYASATHLVTTHILAQLNESAISQLFVSNSIHHPLHHNKLTVVSVAPTLAEFLRRQQKERYQAQSVATLDVAGQATASPELPAHAMYSL